MVALMESEQPQCPLCREPIEGFESVLAASRVVTFLDDDAPPPPQMRQRLTKFAFPSATLDARTRDPPPRSSRRRVFFSRACLIFLLK